MTIWIIDRINSLPPEKQGLVGTWLQANDGCSAQELIAYVDTL